MGPFSRLTFISLFLFLTLLHTQTFHAKPLSVIRSGGRVLEGSPNIHHRLRRDLRDTLPYEAQMMSYPPTAAETGDWRRQGLDQALQRLVENDQRRDQEAAYLASLLRLLDQSEAREAGPEDEPEEEEERPEDFQGPYPPDYDETDRGVNMGKPQASWQGLLDPQVSQALLQRYRQERMLQAGLQQLQIPEGHSHRENHSRDQEILRYMVAKILASIGPSDSHSNPARRTRRDLVAAVAEGGSSKAASPTHRRRSRRSLDDTAPPSQATPLLRVKRLGDGDEVEGEGGAYRVQQQGLQRMKRVDTELHSGKIRRRRRATSYDHDLLIQQILQYLPE